MKNLSVKIFATLALLFSSWNAQAQIIEPKEIVKANITLEQTDCEAFVVVKINIKENWHINSNKLPEGSFSIPSDIIINESKQFKLGPVLEPKPHVFKDVIGDMQSQHKNSLVLKRRIDVLSTSDFVLNGTFEFQTCDEVKCLAVDEYKFSLNVKGCPTATALVPASDTASQTQVQSSDVNKNETQVIQNQNQTTPNKDKVPDSLWMIFLLSFLSGFAALITPCVFPMVPMTVTFFTKRSKTKAAGIRNAVIFGISIIVIYVLLGTFVTAVFGSSALNQLATNVWFNLIFFALLVVFAIAFLGAFEIRLPSKWLNKADQAADKGGYVGIFFMALGLALVSFSCTGPIVGSLLVQSATIGGIAPFIGMFGFSLALALPFMLFAMFPGWMNALPKSGGWLNTIKVVLGFLELALALKFLSNADLVVQSHYLERELFIAIWVGIFTVLALYLFGFIKLPHDDVNEKKIGVGRTLLATLILSFVFYILPGTWGAPVKLISGFPPPMTYSEAGQISHQSASTHSSIEGTHPGPQKIPVFHDLAKAQAYAKSVNKPLFVDFTGYACQNCRKMEENVWGESGVLEILRDKVIIVSLYVDDKTALPKEEQGAFEYAPGKTMEVTEIGHKWSLLQATRYQTNTQPYYRMLGPNGEDLSNGSADYEHHKSPQDFKSWLDTGLTLYESAVK
jgi:thiol:disulfide interchange protein DsbD